MEILILNHIPGCTPLKPCASCVATDFLREKLSDEDFKSFLLIIEEAVHKSVSQSAGNPILLRASIEILDLCPRTMNVLRNANFLTIGDLLSKNENTLLRSPNFGRKSLNELKRELAKHGRQIGEAI